MAHLPPAFRLLHAHPDEPAAVPGATVYECLQDDFGCAHQETRRTGRRHLAVTFDPAGGYPFFTMPAEDLEPIRR
jgi:hypothetical protein